MAGKPLDHYTSRRPFLLPRACVQSSAPGTLDSALGSRRTLRSGKEFSAFDLAVSCAIPSPIPFDIGQHLKERLLEQDAAGLVDEAEHDAEDATPFWLADTPDTADASSSAPSTAAASPLTPSPLAPLSPSPPPTASQRSKQKFKARRAQARDKARQLSDNPLLKAVHRKRIDAAKPSALSIDVDAGALPHTKRVWTGPRPSAGEGVEDWGESLEDHGPQPPPYCPDTGLGGVTYAQAEVDALSGTVGFMYIPWLGKYADHPHPRLTHRRVIALLGGTPRDEAGWKTATDGAATLLEERLACIRLSDERLHHRRAQDSFPAITRGLSHGGGQIEPGELCNNVSNTQLTDELLADPCFQRLAGFANVPSDRTLLAVSLLPALSISARAPSARPTWTLQILPGAGAPSPALGDFDPDLGGHLILWDLRLVIRFPPGSTILLPSAIIRHSNTPIQAHEHRSSFVQYNRRRPLSMGAQWVQDGWGL
ncbi:hypothetical protein B0H14DRAFT_3529203 [Mycena olivaceomarginata]|nr:hypothetical protein B0H14DRAFT_3529203 [Mycena olivaceomarginata]